MRSHALLPLRLIVRRAWSIVFLSVLALTSSAVTAQTGTATITSASTSGGMVDISVDIALGTDTSVEVDSFEFINNQGQVIVKKIVRDTFTTSGPDYWSYALPAGATKVRVVYKPRPSNGILSRVVDGDLITRRPRP